MTFSIGFIGQGWIGKNYADDFERRGFSVTRYGLEGVFVHNREAIKKCDIVFIAVPTPTTPSGFDYSIVEEAVSLVGEGKIAVIKSTVLPGTTEEIQKKYPKIFVLHSPEFLTEATAAHDAANPMRNIVGLPIISDEYNQKAKEVLIVLPHAPYEQICRAVDAEIIKYGRNISGFFRVIFANLLYDLTTEVGGDWSAIREAMSADPDTGPTYLNPIHKSGRGAGGHCYIKDFAAFTRLYSQIKHADVKGILILEALEQKNLELLVNSNKDLDLVTGVYGSDIIASQQDDSRNN